jgi:hypothetical protein
VSITIAGIVLAMCAPQTWAVALTRRVTGIPVLLDRVNAAKVRQAVTSRDCLRSNHALT